MSEFLKSLDDKDFSLALSLLALLIGYVLYHLIARSMVRLASGGHLTQAMAGRLRTLLRLVMLFGSCIVALHLAGAFDHAMTLFAALFTTVAVGFFAMWSVLSNVVCALLILTFRPFQVGDEIEVIEGSAPFPRGKVVDMNLLFVTLEETAEDRSAQLQIPNTLIFQKIVRRLSMREVENQSFYP